MTEKEKEVFFDVISSLKNQGVSIIFISHFLEDVIELSDRVTVLKDGLNNGTFERGNYSKDDLVSAMMGKVIDHTNQNALPVQENVAVSLELVNLSARRKFQNINFKVRSGEIVGICGLLGAGKTELARSIFGLDETDSGEIYLFGAPIKKPRPDLMIKNGVTLLTEERKLEGFVPLLSIRENTTMSILRTLKKRLAIDQRAQCKQASDLAAAMTIKMADIEQSVGSLSGGNQQKTVIAKCLACNPQLFLLDEPTRGVDVYAKLEIYKILHSAANNGTSIIIFSSELEELLANCSRILILKKGQIVGEVNASETSKNDLMTLIA